ncbi:MAG: poly(A) polymerase [Bdellovibrionota bacterium]
MTKTAKPQLQSGDLDPSAVSIVERLQRDGYETYLVGGCVRDLLAGYHPKDFDIATSAKPEQVKSRVPYSFLIGRRFKLVLAKRGERQFEIATFRRNRLPEEAEVEGTIGDNYYGTAEEDAQRRDFTVNALFYDPVKNEVLDYVNGLDDLATRTLRMIGPAGERIIEDPIRVLRGIRLAHKLGMHLDGELRHGIQSHAAEVARSVLPRKREEYLKIMRLKDSARVWFELMDLEVLEKIMPSLHSAMQNHDAQVIFRTYLHHFEDVINQQDPTELFCAFLFSLIKAISNDEPLDVEQILTDEKLDTFMRDELGMYKLEISFFHRALSLIPGLFKRTSFQKRSYRRQSAFLRQEGLDFSLKLAEIDLSLPIQDLAFWKMKVHEFNTDHPLPLKR